MSQFTRLLFVDHFRPNIPACRQVDKLHYLLLRYPSELPLYYGTASCLDRGGSFMRYRSSAVVSQGGSPLGDSTISASLKGLGFETIYGLAAILIMALREWSGIRDVFSTMLRNGWCSRLLALY